MAYITGKQPIPPILQAARRRLRQEQLAEWLSVSFATTSRWKGDVTTPQGVVCTAIAPLAPKEFGDSAR